MSTDERQASVPPPPSDDEKRLHELGYAQELRRSMSGFSNFAVSFTIISVLSGCLTSYTIGLNGGGPVVITWGWLFVGVMTLTVALAMAEVCSSYPTAGGLYYWAAKLARRNGAAWSWFTGWFNFVGQVAVTAAIVYGSAAFLNPLLDAQFGYSVTLGHTFLLFTVILAVHALLNQFGVKLVAVLGDISVWWHVVGVAVVVGVLVVKPAEHQSPGFVFGEFVNGTGWQYGWYAALIGLLLSQYTMTGYDASAHMTEETRDAARSGPRGIVNSVLVSVIAGWVLLVGVTFAIQDYGAAAKDGPAQIFLSAAGETTGKLLILVSFVAQFFCGMASVTANSRMIYAFSRDGALPFSRFWHSINKRTRTPTNAIWLAAGGAWLLALPAIWNKTAYLAVTSVAVVGLYIAYVIPTFLRLRQGDAFRRGPWHLGRWSRPVGIVAVAWVAFISVLFMLPPASPITRDTFNYSPVAVLVVLGGAGLWWLLSARRWFTGPKVQGSAAELAAIENELKSIN
ncbi:amino acid permease [Actinomadura kijaniata]|uniref:Amino acid permease (GABA permease) n=1 Tax=Actinomadura namibiensis TaxID=182080 RepID=A0A7W3LN70_ACTNM|nr:amino acid permease [Actinomadura namibiensis]MBA8951201.1 amino acid permease (GABA permease) [Actinomadura namibiensis]